MQKQQNQWVLYLAMMTIGMGQTIVFAVMPMLGRRLQLDQITFNLPGVGVVEPKELMITALSAITALTFSYASPFWGRLSDRIGRKIIIVTGLIGYTLGMTLFNGAVALGLYAGFAGLGLYALLFLTRIMHASIMSAAIPASNAYMVDVTSDENRSKGLSRVGAATQLGTLCGPALTALLAINYLAPFIFQSLMTLVMGVVVWFFLKDSGHQANTSLKPKKLKAFDRRFRFYTITALVVYTAFGMVQQTLGFYFQDVLHVSNEKAAQLFSFAMIASSSSMLFSQLFLVQRLSFRPLQFIYAGLPVMATGFLVLAMAESLPHLIMAMALFGLAMGMIAPSISAAASFYVEKTEQGALAGAIGSMAGMGFVIGPLVGGFIYSQKASNTYFAASLIIVFLIVSIFAHNHKKNKNRA